MHASSIGKCLMAHMSEEERGQLLQSLELPQITPHTITDRNRLGVQLQEFSQSGFATSHQETDVDVHCFGAVIFDRLGKPVGGMSVSVPLYRLANDHQRYVRPLVAACKRVSAALGG